MYIVLSDTNAHILILLLCADKSCNSMDLNGLLSSHLVHPCKRIKHLQEDLKGDFSSIWLLSLNERRSDYSTTVIIENTQLLCLLRKGSPLVSASTKDYHSEYHLSMTFINMFRIVMLAHLVVELHIRLLTYSPQTIYQKPLILLRTWCSHMKFVTFEI